MRSLSRALLLALLLALGASAPASAIVGGTETQRDWPHMAALELLGDADGDGTQEWSFICGASLVRPDVVLTAAHCVDGSDGSPERFRVALGSRDRLAGERLGATRVVEHPGFDAGGKQDHDVAVLKLERASTQGTPIRIADAGDATRFEPGDEATIIGWGSTVSGGGAVRTLREAGVPIVSDAECERSYTVTADFDPPTMLCAGNLTGGEDSCQGDSGGPLMVPGADGRFVLVADTSFGVGCAFPTQYGVYGEVAGATLRPWVMDRLRELSPDTAPPAAGTGTPAAPAGQPSSETSAPRLTLPRSLGSVRSARRRGRAVVLLRTTGAVRTLRATLRQGGRTIATGRRAKLSSRAGRVTLRLRGRRPRAGRATLTVTARDAGDRVLRVSRSVRFRD